MKIKSVSFLLVVLLMLALVSGGVMAAPVTHDISEGDVIINSCGDDCPGHVITGEVNASSYNIQILSGDHKVTLKDLLMYCTGIEDMNAELIREFSALYIADGVQNVELTIEGEVIFSSIYGLYCAADQLKILGDDTSDLELVGRFEAAHVENDLVITGGRISFGTGLFSGPNSDGTYYKKHLRGLVVDGTATFDDVVIDAYTNEFSDEGPQSYPGGAEDDVASAVIEADKLVVKNSSIHAKCSAVGYAEGKTPKSIAIDAVTMEVTDSDILAFAEDSYDSIGIRATQIAVNGGSLEGRGSNEAVHSYGIYMKPSQTSADDIPVKFDIVNGNVIANGSTLGLLVEDDNFAGVSYKADENAKAELKNDFTNERFLFGNKYKVSFDADGINAKNMPADAAYYKGETFLLPNEIPTAEGYRFVGWMDGFGHMYYPPNEALFFVDGKDMVFTAVWKCLGGKDCILHELKDLDPKLWYHDGIEYCYVTEIMVGTSETAFEPYTETSRAMAVTVLYRFLGKPEAEGKVKFSDVKEDTWYTDAVKWATENGIVEGYTDGTFRPDRIATREELAVFLYRFAEYMDLNPERKPLPDTFTDKDEVSDWALPAMEWAVGTADIINGVDETTLSPKTYSNRAQLATMVYRLYEFFVSEFEF